MRQLTRILVIGSIIVATLLVYLNHHESRRSRKSFLFFESATPESVARQLSSGDRSRASKFQKSLDDLNEVFIEDYVPWHNATVHLVRSKQLDGSRVRTLVYSGNNGEHGLGDLFRGILSAYITAVFSNRILLLDLRNPFPIETIFLNSDRSNFTYDESLFSSPEFSTSNREQLTVKGPSNILDMDKYLGDETQVFMKVEPRPNIHLIFQIAEKYPSLRTSVKLRTVEPTLNVHPKYIYSLIFRALFQPSDEMLQMIDTVTSDYPIVDMSKDFVSLHVRLGSGVGENIKRFTSFMNGRTLNSIADCLARKALRYARASKLSRQPRFYLATDTHEFRRAFSDSVRKLDESAVVMYGPWQPRHTRSLSTSGESDLQEFRQTFLDLFFLSRGKSMLKGRSGFPNLAVWMGSISNQKQYNINKDCLKEAEKQ